MRFNQYLRVETAAGGIACTDLQFIRAAWKLLSKRGKTAQYRKFRRDWLRAGLRMLHKNQGQYLENRF